MSDTDGPSGDGATTPDGHRMTEVEFLAHRLDRHGRALPRIGLASAIVSVLMALGTVVGGLSEDRPMAGLLWAAVFLVVGALLFAVLRATGTYLRLRAAEALNR